MERRYVPLAEVARPHGVRGELRVKVYNEDSELLLHAPTVRLRMADGTERDVAIAGARSANKALLVRIAGVGDRNAAELLRGAVLCLARESFPPLEDGEFYACDLEGARAILRSGEEVGRVTGLRTYPTCHALAIDRGDHGTIEVPLVDSYVDAVDLEEGIVRLVTLEGLA